MIRLKGDGLNQLVADRHQEGCRALLRMLAPVPQNDSGTSLQSLSASSRSEILTAHSDREM